MRVRRSGEDLLRSLNSRELCQWKSCWSVATPSLVRSKCHDLGTIVETEHWVHGWQRAHLWELTARSRYLPPGGTESYEYWNHTTAPAHIPFMGRKLLDRVWKHWDQQTAPSPSVPHYQDRTHYSVCKPCYQKHLEDTPRLGHLLPPGVTNWGTCLNFTYILHVSSDLYFPLIQIILCMFLFSLFPILYRME
jgi:hypothetical protein